MLRLRVCEEQRLGPIARVLGSRDDLGPQPDAHDMPGQGMVADEIGDALLKRGGTVNNVRELAVFEPVLRMKNSIPNEHIERFRELGERLDHEFDDLDRRFP